MTIIPFNVFYQNAISSLPAPLTTTSEGYVNNNPEPGVGILPTVIGPDWYNKLVTELNNIVIASGITTSSNSYNTLLTAIQTLAGVALESYDTTGYTLATTYTNTNSGPRFVIVYATSTASQYLIATVNTHPLCGTQCSASGQIISIQFMVPVGAQYSVQVNAGSVTGLNWSEL